MPLFESGADVGRYKLLGKLATGGMAEIYLARQSGPSGFSKVVVLKVILPHLASDSNFMNMFANEAKLAALLNHPNVVQVFDYGEEKGLPFMAMEYIDGRNLTRIGKVLHERGEKIPRAIALRVISEVCGALDYAHGLCDNEGNHLRIVHRDISRENILLTYSGRVKLVDFGIAKSAILESYTTEGTIKGKYGYMAPEVIRGGEPDHLIDVYALGVVLYAALLAAMPFRAKNHAQLLEMILNKEPPAPREIDPSVPEDLEAIILRAMHKDRDERYERISDLQHALEGFLVQYETSVLPYHLTQFMASTFPAGTDKDRETYQGLTGATPHTPSLQTKAPALTPSGSDVLSPSTVDVVDFQPRRLTRSHWLMIAAALLAVGGGILLYLLLSPSKKPPDKPVKTVRVVPDARPQPPPDAAVAQRPKPDMKPARPKPVHRRPKVGFLWVEAPAPGEVLIGKRRLGMLPLVKRPLPVGTHRLTVRSQKLGYRMDRPVTVTAGGQHRVRFAPRKGTIRILVHPWARVTLDGTLLGITPLKPISVYEGHHLLVLHNSELKQKRRRWLQVRPGQESLVKIIFE